LPHARAAARRADRLDPIPGPARDLSRSDNLAGFAARAQLPGERVAASTGDLIHDLQLLNSTQSTHLFVFDVAPPRQHEGWQAYKKDWQDLFAAFPGPTAFSITDLSITVVGSVAYSHSIQASKFTGKDGSKVRLVVRVTDVYRKLKGQWLIVQEHVSVPVDIATQKPDLLSKP
jgi:ketosteroid isomerase-like protein